MALHSPYSPLSSSWSERELPRGGTRQTGFMYVIKTHVLFFHAGAVFTQYPSKKKVRRPIKHPFIPDKEESVSTREVEIHICGFFLLSLYAKATLSKGKRSARQESQVQLSGPYSHSLPFPPPPPPPPPPAPLSECVIDLISSQTGLSF